MILTQRLKPRVMLDLTPLIDVVFQLVIFFMISSVFNTAPGIELDLPDSTTSEAVEVTEVRITVAGSEEIYLNRDLVALPNLGKTLREWSNQGRLTDDTAVLVEGGKAVPYETIITVLDEVRRGGVTAISLITAPISEVP
ncbi:MAG: biopolymer transporter ExbD [Spirochaetaceae bacterium]|nr:biopolymer transporter ExbD [Spirochaetaceae bacterium]MDT8297896.1 biopolymer transporter ExbD [Spirochaetaceae bacterium]